MFTSEQRTEIEKTTLSKVICANSANISAIVKDSFILSNLQTNVNCSVLPDINLAKF